MVRRALLLSLLASAACGGAVSGDSGLNVSVLVSGAVAPLDSYRVRVFGSAVKCGDILAQPSEFELGASDVCAGGQDAGSNPCLLAYLVFDASAGDDAIDDISPGQRAVFVEGLAGGQVAAIGCASVAVVAGQSADATVTLK